MKIGNLFNVFKPVMKQIEKHDRTILTAVTVVSTLYAVYRAAKDGPKFKKILDPETGEPKYGVPETCYLDYESLMSPTGDFEARDPL